jgi:hypothetical protein
LQNITAGQLPENQNSKVSDTFQGIQMQLHNIISVDNTGNMEEVMANLQQTDEQLAAVLPSLGYTGGGTNSTIA